MLVFEPPKVRLGKRDPEAREDKRPTVAQQSGDSVDVFHLKRRFTINPELDHSRILITDRASGRRIGWILVDVRSLSGTGSDSDRYYFHGDVQITGVENEPGPEKPH